MTARDVPAPSAGGRLFLVVGPSGAGKDTLIHAARKTLTDADGFAFPRRIVTRPAHAASEDFVSATVEAFEAQEAAGAFLLSWRSHGLRYGVPAAAAGLVADGRRVVVNVSRTVVDTARARFGDTRIIQVVAPVAVLRHRLRDRGRELPDDIDRRVARAAALTIDGPDVTTVENGGDLDRTVSAFIAALREG